MRVVASELPLLYFPQGLQFWFRIIPFLLKLAHSPRTQPPRPCSLAFAGSLFFSSETPECCILSEKTAALPTPAWQVLGLHVTAALFHPPSRLSLDSGL